MLGVSSVDEGRDVYDFTVAGGRLTSQCVDREKPALSEKVTGFKVIRMRDASRWCSGRNRIAL
jgi:hypothetical protein